MPPPADWSIRYNRNTPNQIKDIGEIRAICPWCLIASTFAIKSQYIRQGETEASVHLVIECNHSRCRRNVYVYTTALNGQINPTHMDAFYMHPSRATTPPHTSIPPSIAEDWLEGLKSLNASAPKAAAVMFRRVLYGVLIDKHCPLHPIHDGLKKLVAQERLPAIFDRWLPAIKDDGHDAAHPDRALQVNAENINETQAYTAELLRYLYIEPYEFEHRTVRIAASKSSTLG